METLPNMKPSESEIKKARDEAVKAGLSPDNAQAALEKKFKKANARILEDESERMLNETGAFFTDYLKKNKDQGRDGMHI